MKGGSVADVVRADQLLISISEIKIILPQYKWLILDFVLRNIIRVFSLHPRSVSLTMSIFAQQAQYMELCVMDMLQESFQ